jgi:hypothetical protein
MGTRLKLKLKHVNKAEFKIRQKLGKTKPMAVENVAIRLLFHFSLKYLIKNIKIL